MPLRDLLDTLEQDAAAEIATVMAAAEADVKRIADTAQCDCTARHERATRELTDAQRARADVALAEAARRARRDVLDARAAMLAKLRTAIVEELPGVVDEALRAKLLAAALAHAGDAARVEHVPAGVIVDDGCVLVDATLEAVLERAWPRIAAEAVAAVEVA